MNITIIGLGLIGGSIALELKSQLCVTVFGVDKNTDHQQQAIALGLVSEIVTLQEGVEKADVVVLATPVDTVERLLPQVLDIAGPQTAVTDVGSTKASICKAVEDHKMRDRYVAAHPLAGTEFSGPQAALMGLFRNKKNIICEQELSAPDALETVTNVFKSLGLTSSYMGAREHDRHMAYVSHLSHVTSFTLGLTVLNIEKDEKQIFNLASTGFDSTARLAKSNPDTWAAIFDKNNEYLVEALDGYIDHLQKFRTSILASDTLATKALMSEANEIKRILKK